MLLQEHNKIRDLFPPLKNNNMVYLDSAATTLKPLPVINKLMEYYQEYPANVHRGLYKMAEKANAEYERARETVKDFVNAAFVEEIIVTRGTTEAINLISLSWGEENIEAGDRIFVSLLEHHSNILPWHKLAERKGAKMEFIPITPQGEIDLEAYKKLLDENVKLVAITLASNVLGSIIPLENIISLAHSYGAMVCVDAAQAVAHIPIDVQSLDCDFLCFSGHKVYGPTGVGIFYGKRHLLENMPPHFYGGGMADRLQFNETNYTLPHKFEAGTPPIASFIALGAAIKFTSDLGFEFINSHEKTLIKGFTEEIKNLPDLKILGDPQEKIGVFSIVADHIHAHDLGTFLDSYGIAARVGHHCASPLMKYYKVPSTLRISFGIYNNLEDIERTIFALNKIMEVFK